MITMVYAKELIDELRWHSKKEHAKIVYSKCILAKRYEWAMKIAYHYGLQDQGNNNDTVMSFGIALMSAKTRH